MIWCAFRITIAGRVQSNPAFALRKMISPKKKALGHKLRRENEVI